METSNHSDIRQRFIGVSDADLLTLIQSNRREDAVVQLGIRVRPVILKILYRDYCANLKGVSSEVLVAEVIADLLLDPPKAREGEHLQLNRVYLAMRVQRTVSGWKSPHQVLCNQPTVSMEQPVFDSRSHEALKLGETLSASQCHQPEIALLEQHDEDEVERTCDDIRQAIDSIGNAKHREAVRRRLVEGQEYPQISAELKVTQTYARKMYQLGLNSVRAAMPPQVST